MLRVLVDEEEVGANREPLRSRSLERGIGRLHGPQQAERRAFDVLGAQPVKAAAAEAVDDREVEHRLARRPGQTLDVDADILLEDIVLGDAVLTQDG